MPFDGQQANWTTWSTKKKALLKLRKEWHPFEGYFGYETNQVKIKLPTWAEYYYIIQKNVLYRTEHLKIKAYEDNDQAYHYLLLSVNHHAFDIVTDAVTTANPDGIAELAWKNLFNRSASEYQF